MKVIIELPKEYIEKCRLDQLPPDAVLRSFIADVCGISSWASQSRKDGYVSNGSDERALAQKYYERVGYPYIQRLT